MLEGETHQCIFCLYKHKYSEDKPKTPVRCNGCDMLRSPEKIKWILGCFKRTEIVLHWEDSTFYKNPTISSDMTCLKLQ